MMYSKRLGYSVSEKIFSQLGDEIRFLESPESLYYSGWVKDDSGEYIYTSEEEKHKAKVKGHECITRKVDEWKILGDVFCDGISVIMLSNILPEDHRIYYDEINNVCIFLKHTKSLRDNERIEA